MPGSEWTDAEARLQIRKRLDCTMVVEAAAGTGKTSELIGRIVEVLASGAATVNRIVAVTFTEKAAGELKLRLRAQLEEARQASALGSERAAALEDALAHLEEAQINTIHGFCADLLRERPVEAAVDPRFQVLSEQRAQALYREAFEAWLQKTLENPPEGLRRALRRRSSSNDEDGPVARLRQAGWQLAEWRDFPAPWRRERFARSKRLAEVVEQLHAFAELSARGRKSDLLYRDTEPCRQTSEQLRTMQRAGCYDEDRAEAEIVQLARMRDFCRSRSGSGKYYAPDLTRKAVLTAHGELVRTLQGFARKADADLAALLRDELWNVVERYDHLKSNVPMSVVREDPDRRPSVIVLPVPAPYGVKDITMRAIDESLPDAVGAFVDWLIGKSGWTVTERGASAVEVPLCARHVCILFRRFKTLGRDVTRPYLQALEARGIPHLLVGGRFLHEREEVETIRAALSAIEWPEDELSVYATLHGSLFAIPDENLFEYRHRYGHLNPFCLPERDVPERLRVVVEVLQLLGDLHRQRNRFPVAKTIHRLLEQTRAPASFTLRPSGEQVLANVLHIAELARAYEAQGGLSFRGFVEQLRSEAENVLAAEAPVLDWR